MALSKTAKIWLIILSIPVVLIAGGLIAAKLYFTGERLKSLIIPRIEESTGRTVSVQDISLSIFPALAVSIDKLKISNPQGASFERDEFLSLDHLKLKVKIFELLQSKLEISYIILDHPKVYLEMTEDGAKNYSGKKTDEDSNVRVKVETDKGGALLLSNLEIIDGEIEQVDKKFNSRMLIKGLHQTASVEARPGESTIFINGISSIELFSYGSLKSWYISNQPVTAESKISFNPTKDALSLDAVNIKVRDLPLSMTGSLTQLTQDVMNMDITVTSPGAQMTQLLSIIPPEMLKSAQGLSSSGEVKFIMTIKGPSNETLNPGIQGSFTVANGKIQYASLPKSITNVNVAGSFEKPSVPVGKTGIGSFSIDKLTATIGSNTIGGKMRVTNFDDPSLSAIFSGAMNLGEVKEFYPLEQGTEMSGTMKANVSVDGKPKSPQTMKASGTIAFQNVVIKTAGSPKPLKNLNGTMTFNNQVIESKQLAMNIGESDMTLAFTLKNYMGMAMESAAKTSGTPTATVTLTSKQLRTADVMSDKTVASPTEPEKKPTGEKQGGLLPGFDVDANVNIDKLVTEKFTFSNAKGTVNISHGVVNLKNFNVNAFNGTIQSKGMIDLRDPKKSPFNLDLDIKNVESNALLSNFTSFGQYLFGKFSTTTKLQGDLNDTLGLTPQTLLGNGTVDITSGKLIGLPLAEKIAEFTSLTELREVNFKDWTNAFSISNGRLNVNDLKVTSSVGDFLVGGSQGLDGSMDYDLTIKLPASVSDRIKLGGIGDQILQFFKDNDGRINLPLNVSGMSTSPVVRLDAKAQENAAKNALQQKVDESKKKLEDELKKKAAEGLKNLFKKP